MDIYDLTVRGRKEKKMDLSRRKVISVIALALTAALLAVILPLYITAGTDATVKSYEEQLANISTHIQQAESELASIRNKEYKTQDEIAKLDELIMYNESLIALTQKQLDAINGQIVEKEQRIDDLTKEIDNREELFLDRMVSDYMEEDADYLEIILGAESISDFLSKFEYVTSVLEQDKKIVAKLAEDKETLAEEQIALAEAKEVQAAKMADFQSAIEESNARYDEKMSVMAQLELDEQRSIDAYTYYKQLENEKNLELQNYLAELQKKSQSTYVGGTGGWPLQAGVTVYVTSEYGWRTLWGSRDFHLGIDLACPKNTEIYAFNSGTVLKSECHYSYGEYVLVDHGGGISTLYAHMNSRAVQAGDYVQAGQLLGYVGMTGSASGFHLHFETRENGETVDPRNYITP